MNKSLAIRILLGAAIVVGAALIVNYGLKHAHNMHQESAANPEAAPPPTPDPSEPPTMPQTAPQPLAAAPQPRPNPAPQPAPAPAEKPPTAKNFIIEIDDYTAEPDSITVDQGTEVTLVVRAKNTNVYHGGIELRSPVVNTGAIAAGSSATISFTANDSFEFTPYWPASGIKKDYTFKVNVKKPL
jgi:hypothetical protein